MRRRGRALLPPGCRVQLTGGASTPVSLTIRSLGGGVAGKKRFTAPSEDGAWNELIQYTRERAAKKAWRKLRRHRKMARWKVETEEDRMCRGHRLGVIDPGGAHRWARTDQITRWDLTASDAQLRCAESRRNIPARWSEHQESGGGEGGGSWPAYWGAPLGQRIRSSRRRGWRRSARTAEESARRDQASRRITNALRRYAKKRAAAKRVLARVMRRRKQRKEDEAARLLA